MLLWEAREHEMPQKLQLGLLIHVFLRKLLTRIITKNEFKFGYFGIQHCINEKAMHQPAIIS